MASPRPFGNQILPVLAGIVCAVSLMFLIGNLGNLDLGPGTQGSKDLVLQMEGMLLPILGILWLVVLMMLMLTTKKKQGKAKGVAGRPASGFLWGLLLIATILILANIFGGNTLMPQGSGASGEDGGISGPPPDTDGTPPTLSSAAFPIAGLILAVAVIVAAVLVMRRGMRPVPTAAADVPAATTEAEPSQAVAAAIVELESHPDARSGILAAYGRMTEKLGRPGEDRTLTPREFALKTGWKLKESAPSLRALTSLFEEARYSDHPMGEEERKRALAALRDIEGELGRKAS